MSQKTRLKIDGGALITPRETLDGALWIAGDRIVGVGNDAPDDGDWKTLDATGLYVSPGFIDPHVHGGGGADFMDGTPEAAIAAAEYHATGGTTALLATLGTDSLHHWIRMIDAATEASARTYEGARILGAHVEGGYFNPARKGCHLEQYIRHPNPDETAALLEHADDIRWLTLAPELPGTEPLIRAMSERGVIVSAGHSEADYETMVRAVEWGLSHSTHLYNAMSGVIKRPPARHGGIVETSLLLDEITTEIISDGRHLPSELMRLAFKCKGVDGLILVTDAQRAAGMPDGEYVFGRVEQGAPFIVENGVAMIHDRSGYASSTIQMIDAVRIAVEMVGATLSEAVAMATLTPATILGEDKQRGSLEIGKQADIAIFDGSWAVRHTFVAGREVYASE